MKRVLGVGALCQEDGYDFYSTPDRKFSHQKLHVTFYSVQAQAEGVSDLFISEASNQQTHNLLFPAVEVKLPDCP